MVWDCHWVGAEKVVGSNNNIVIVGSGIQCTFVGGIVMDKFQMGWNPEEGIPA